ncbi:putative B3 domain-containing protein Os06g0632500 [Phragmites australis]|uniref:putative B3 domain-containing protein Os06g0632500 n=1 Tax=Phragmites australis TaxID=29695 RepID=UPI002D79D8C4|nr:putative B3 domain-containing protein Os06g0632500 [Phragmites australis]
MAVLSSGTPTVAARFLFFPRAQPHRTALRPPSMARSVHRARPKYTVAPLSPSCLHKLGVPREFAARLGGGDAGEGEGAVGRAVVVLLVSPLGKVWRVELRRAGGGGARQLGGGWADFAAAHGVGVGWSVVFRLERRGVATVRAFDAACCLARFCTSHAGKHHMSKNRPRFISLLHPDDLEKMKIPDKFVQEHLTESCPSSQNAMICSALGKFWRIELDRDQPGVLLGDGWEKFLTAHDLSEGNILVFRYEGNMVFTVEVFLQNGCLKEYEAAAAADISDDVVGPKSVLQEGAKQLGVSPVKRERKNRNENACVHGSHKRPKVSAVPAKKVVSQEKIVSKVPPHSITKQITWYDLKPLLAVKGTFCSSVGVLGPCEITLKTSMDNTANTYCYITGPGWKRFCEDNKVKDGDCCTFNVIETRVWHVTIVSN